MRSRMPQSPKLLDCEHFLRVNPIPSSSTSKRKAAVAIFQGHPKTAGAGMFGDVVQRFLHRAVDREFDLRIQPRQDVRKFELAFRPVFRLTSRTSLRMAGSNPRRSRVCGRKPAYDAAQIFDGVVEKSKSFLNFSLRLGVQLAGSQHPQIQAQYHQSLTGAVVQLTADALSLFFLGAHQMPRNFRGLRRGHIAGMDRLPPFRRN